MGKVIVPVRMWNILDERAVERGEVQPIEVEALIDTGAMTSVVSDELADRLGLIRKETVLMGLADGRKVRRPIAVGLRAEAMGRNTVLRVILEPSRKIPLLGQLFLEDTLLLVDCKNGRLIHDPAYGGEEVYEVLSVAPRRQRTVQNP